MNIGFVSTRFAGTDGVSLESAKWADVLEEFGHKNAWFAGKVGKGFSPSVEIPLASLDHPEIVYIRERAFGHYKRSRDTSNRIREATEVLKDALHDFLFRFAVDVLVVQNALTIPMNIPLGIALTEIIAETCVPTIAHHHDFYWERVRYSVSSVDDLLAMSFPATLPSIEHVTINTAAQRELSWRRGVTSRVIPNALDFEQEQLQEDAPNRADELRQSLGLKDDDIIFLQPTRVVPRKGIELSIALVAQLNDPRYKLLISHESGDEGHEYERALVDMAIQENVELLFLSTRVGPIGPAGGKRREGRFTLDDAYALADFITYPSLYEGFGNALIEAFLYRRPILVNRYSIFISDIEPRGFRAVKTDGYLTRETVAEVRRVVEDEPYRREMVTHNFELGKRFYGFDVLRRQLRGLIGDVASNQWR